MEGGNYFNEIPLMNVLQCFKFLKIILCPGLPKKTEYLKLKYIKQYKHIIFKSCRSKINGTVVGEIIACNIRAPQTQ